MNKFQILKEFWKVYREGEFLGDAAILKGALGLSKFEPSPELKDVIESYPAPPDFSEIPRDSLDEGTLGKAYYQFLEKNNFNPFRFSGKYDDLMKRNKLIAIYASVHDVFHVLTGYDPSWAGEMGVWAFVKGQNISPQADLAVKFAHYLYPLYKFNKRSLIYEAEEEGLTNGEKARCLMKMDFKKQFYRPLTDVRDEFQIRPTQMDAIKIEV